MNLNEITLDKLELNHKGTIKKLNCLGNIRRRFLDLGLINGTTITPVLISACGDPVAYEIRGTVIAIRSEDAKMIEVLKK